MLFCIIAWIDLHDNYFFREIPQIPQTKNIDTNFPFRFRHNTLLYPF